jgi:hypothetical protein
MSDGGDDLVLHLGGSCVNSIVGRPDYSESVPAVWRRIYLRDSSVVPVLIVVLDVPVSVRACRLKTEYNLLVVIFGLCLCYCWRHRLRANERNFWSWWRTWFILIQHLSGACVTGIFGPPDYSERDVWWRNWLSPTLGFTLAENV